MSDRRATLRRLGEQVLDRGDVVMIVLILLAVQALRTRPPTGIYALGIVGGAYLALHAVGLILVYRAHRIINFAQVAVGAVSASLFDALVRYEALIRGAQHICPPCLRSPGAGVRHANYVVALVLGIAVAVVLSWLTYVLIVKRFAGAPRLVLTVATIFLTQMYTALALWLPRLLSTDAQRHDLAQVGATLRPPIDVVLTIAPVRLHGPELLLLAVSLAGIGGLALYLRRSATGIAIRAAAENTSRAQTLGVNVGAVTARVWLLAGLVSALATVLTAMSGDARAAAGALSVSFLVRMLTVGVIARFWSLPMAAAGALAIGILDASVEWAYHSLVFLDAVFVVVVVVALFLQRGRASRAELEAASAWKASREVRPIPSELRHLPAVRSLVRNLPIAGVVVALGYPWAMDAGQTSTACYYLILGVIALSLLVLTGWSGQISLGHVGFAALGAYTVGAWHLPFLVALLVAGGLGALAAVLIGLPALRLRGLELAVVTLAFGVTGTQLLLNPRYLGRSVADTVTRPQLLGVDLADGRAFYYTCLVLLVAVVLAVMGMRRSRFARVLMAGRDNSAAAQSFGVSLLATRLAAFAVAGFLASVAGAMLAYFHESASVQYFGAALGIEYFIMAVIGGLGSVASPLIGALYFGILTTLSENPIVVGLATGGAGVLLMIVMPGGIGLLLFDLRDAWLRRLARRHRIVVPSLLADWRADGRDVAPIAPKMRPGGGEVFVPPRYALDDQWLIAPETAEPTHA